MSVIQSTAYDAPGASGSPVALRERYDNFIGGEWIAPTTGEYRGNVTPSTGEVFCEVAHSGAQDIELALDAAHAAKDEWGQRSPAERAAVLNDVADAIDENAEMLAVAESYENGKPVRETLAADIPLAADHFRYFAAAVRAEEGRISEIDDQTYAYHFQEPLGVVGQIIPFNFPLLMAAWKIAPALAAGNCTVLKPASPTPWSILKLAEVIGGDRPAGRAEHRQRSGRGDRQGAGLEQADREGLVYRRDGDRTADHELRRAEPDPVDDGARWQVAEHLLRGCDGGRRRVPGQGDRGSRAVRLQQGRGVHVPVAGADPGIDLRQVHGALPGAHRARSSRATRSIARR